MLSTSLQSLPTPASVIVPAQMAHVWRASELAISRSPTCPTGHPGLDAELPGRGWPRSTLVEILLQQSGIGELQLLKPVLARLSRDQRVAIIQPPHIPQGRAFKTWGLDTSRLLWIRATSSGDALWTAEQILKNGSCGAVILWQNNVRSESLRRLNLAAQSTDTWFWLMRPMSAASEASPAPLRLGLRPALCGVAIEIVKRRGPCYDQSLFVPLPDMPTSRHPLDHQNAVPSKHLPAVLKARNAAPVLV